jgi:hypothetical protein
MVAGKRLEVTYTFIYTGIPHIALLTGSRKTRALSETALSEVYTKASIQKLQSAA